MHTKPSNQIRRAALAGVSLLALASTPGLAFAQESEVESVVVTASRVQRDGYEAPTPTTIVGMADIQKQAPANVADYINQLPQLSGGGYNSPRTTSFSVGGASGGNSFNLRSLGNVRTLVLMDGQRVAPSSQTGIVDVNLLPTNLVSRVDIVTGGASAAYGSDAVAGVVNFVLDKNFTGFKGNFNYGQSWKYGDGGTFAGDLAAGFRFAGDRGHVLLSGRVERVSPIERNDSRDWYTGIKAIANPNRTATNGQPGFLAREDVGITLATSGGLIPFGPLAGTQFGAGGQVLPYRAATLSGGILGTGGDQEDIGGDYQILAESRNTALFGRVSYDLTDRLNVYADIGYGKSITNNVSSVFINFANLLIRSDNPFIPSGLNLQGLTSFAMGRIYNDPGIGPVRIHNDRTQHRYVAGLEGSTSWFDDTFKFDAYYQYGKTDQYTLLTQGDINRANLALATDVVRNPAVGGVPGIAVGVPVCRSTITNPTNRCQPFNPFGSGSPSPQSIAYVNGDPAFQHVFVRQDAAAATVRFDPFSLPAGPVSVATGIEYRREAFRTEQDALSNSVGALDTPRFFGNYKRQGGSYNVKDVFGEVVIPVLKDVPFADKLDFNGAVRLTDYSTSGRVTTWKAGVVWDVNSDFRLRGTRSRDIRAPNLNDLFLAAGGGNIGILDPRSGTQVFVRGTGAGNPNLVPEAANTTSFGIVFHPTWLSGFSASADRYKINIGNAIYSAGSQIIVNLCYGGGGQPVTPSACSNIILDPASNGGLNNALVRGVGLNLASRKVSGWDFEVSYRKELAEFSENLPGSIDVRAVGSYLTDYSFAFTGVTYDLKGMPFIGGLPDAGGPEWRWLITGSYRLGPSTTTVNARYVGKGVVNNEAPGSAFSIDQNNIPSRTYIDLNQSFDVTALGVQGQIYGQVQNLFDKDPPPIPSQAGTAYASSGTDASYYDLIGRTWRVGFRFRF